MSRFDNRPRRDGARRRGAVACLCVVVGHVAILWLLHMSATRYTPHDPQTPPQRITLRLIPWRAPPAAAAAPAPRRTDSPPTTQAPTTTRPHLPSAARIPQAAAASASTAIGMALPEAVSAAASAASAPVAMPSLMDTDATRRAIRASARTPGLGDRAAAVSDEPRRASAQERLGNDVKASAKGDCVKGEYLGAGMGLLSLPFLALAAARGACAQ